jgi:hypothetical protein
MRCPACDQAHIRRFLEIDNVPVLCNVLSRTPEDARAVPRGRIELALCRDCGMIFNAAFDPAALAYEGRYENALHFSPSFRKYVEDLASDLAGRHALAGKEVVEIGAGDGYFLGALCQRTGCTGAGYDPAFAPERSMLPEGSLACIHAEPFAPQHASRASLVACRHVLEHIPQPLAFLASLRESLAPGTPVFFEVPDADYMVHQGAVWDVLYEHCSYFSAGALACAFELAGFNVDRTASTYGGQFLTIEATAGRRSDFDCNKIDPAAVSAFSETYHAKVALWVRRLERLGAAQVALWGAGTKGICFLNALSSAAPAISAVVDLNPRKWGHYCAGTGHEIVPPERLKDLAPHLVVVANPLYRSEITDSLATLGIPAEVAAL